MFRNDEDTEDDEEDEEDEGRNEVESEEEDSSESKGEAADGEKEESQSEGEGSQNKDDEAEEDDKSGDGDVEDCDEEDVEDGTGRLPFFLEGENFNHLPSPFNQLLFVVGQNDAEDWSSFPEKPVDGRSMKKIGEGAYGEVFATSWGVESVVVKIVPFEVDESHRHYNGDYHSGQLPIGEAGGLSYIIGMPDSLHFGSVDGLAGDRRGGSQVRASGSTRWKRSY